MGLFKIYKDFFKSKNLKFYVIIFILLYLMFFIVSNNKLLNNTFYTYLLEDNIHNKNLSLPFPKETINIYNTNNDYTLKLYALNITQFHNKVIENYIYNSDYDCKYWSYVYLTWWKYHQNEYKFNIINTNNHIFIIMYNDNYYYILDENTITITELQK